MRGCLQKAKVKRPLPKGEFAWNIILALGRGADGKHKQKWVRFHGTRKQAEQKLTELTGEVQRGEFVEPSKTTLGEWLDKWLEMAIRPRCAPNTYSTYFRIMKVHLKPGLGHVLLQQLTPLHVERYSAGDSAAGDSLCGTGAISHGLDAFGRCYHHPEPKLSRSGVSG